MGKQAITISTACPCGKLIQFVVPAEDLDCAYDWFDEAGWTKEDEVYICPKCREKIEAEKEEEYLRQEEEDHDLTRDLLMLYNEQVSDIVKSIKSKRGGY